MTTRLLLFFVVVLSSQVVSGVPLSSVDNTTASSSRGTPFPAPTKAGHWQWVSIKGSQCINGAATGVHIKYGPKASRKLGIYLSGGGACFNLFTCATCRKISHPGAPGTGGIFDSKDPRNPFKDFHWIHVPYCSGDVHMGANKYKGHKFNGRNNLQLMVDRALATFPTLDTLAVTGESAGGFGAAANYYFLRSQWPSASHGVLLDDSGPILDDQAIAPCLQETWRRYWNLNATLPPGCPCVGDKGNIVSAWKYVRAHFPKDSYGLISSIDDAVISSFFSFGDDNCKVLFPSKYNALAGGLQRLSDNEGVPVYMIKGAVHTHTGDKSSFYTLSSGGTLLYKWVAQLVSADMPNPGTVKPKKKLNSTLTIATK